MINGDHIDSIDEHGTRRQSRRPSALSMLLHRMKSFRSTRASFSATADDGSVSEPADADPHGRHAPAAGSAASTAKSSDPNSGSSSSSNNSKSSSNSNSSVGSPKGGRKETYLSRLMLQTKASLEQLDADNVTWPKLEAMAVLIHESMSSSSRNYHSVQHVFDISKRLMHDPIAVLSAFFHDCIYYHVDGALSPVQTHVLHGVFTAQPDGKQTVLVQSHQPDSDAYDRPLHLVQTVFGLHMPGQQVTTFTGLNEFLSAIMAVRKLQDHLSWEHLAQIACCIEATIPFRKPTVDPHTHATVTALDRLHSNLLLARDRFHLDLSDQQCVRAVQRAALLANEDVGNFGTNDRYWFLDNTWSLLPETNVSLRNQYIYTVHEFQHAIFKMNGFFTFVQPELVFASFRGVPSDTELQQQLQECKTNLRIGKIYVGAKLLAISFLAAFAELTGGDAPISLFMGDLPSRHASASSSYGSSDDAPLPLFKDASDRCDPIVYSILAYGRRSETSFDIKQSPLAAYFYGWLGDNGVNNILSRVTPIYPITRDNSLQLLKLLPRKAVQTVVNNMLIKVAVSRSDMIQKVLQELPAVEE